MSGESVELVWTLEHGPEVSLAWPARQPIHIGRSRKALILHNISLSFSVSSLISFTEVPHSWGWHFCHILQVVTCSLLYCLLLRWQLLHFFWLHSLKTLWGLLLSLETSASAFFGWVWWVWTEKNKRFLMRCPGECGFVPLYQWILRLIFSTFICRFSFDHCFSVLFFYWEKNP